ncbi:acyl-CoA carboxylase subunit epsilon [Streptomyces sp. MUM 2J]|uniref:acyl-CoA carboxylase subunit epsilon n=1 Tax=Streptomyces sp. MUM 2J TaxID=2791987 RepID=UPI001F03337F|nr:acyl-CoA carboxylase subunit epsilon [Streptomyces sp. MUM 2J]
MIPASRAPAAGTPVVRVERGHASDAELAALTVVLLSRAGTTVGRPATPAAPRWDRPERNTPYRAPVGWRCRRRHREDPPGGASR